MSVLRPKDGDYIVRGIILLLGWTLFGWMPFALAGALLAGPGGAAIGLLVGIAVGVLLYGPYLDLDPRTRKRKN